MSFFLDDIAGMMGTLSGISSSFGNIFGGGGNAAANRYQTEANREAFQYNTGEANKARDFLSNEAAAQRNWQKSMAETSYQRAVGDMQSAGLNPMLAYSQGGSNAGSGASAGSSPSPSGPAHSAVSSQGLTKAQTADLVASAALKASQARLNEAQVPLASAQADAATASAGQARAQTGYIGEQVRVARAQVDNLLQDTQKKLAESNLASSQQETERVRKWLVSAQRDLAEIDGKLKNQQISQSKAEEEYRKVLTNLDRLKIPRATNEAIAEETEWKKNIAPFLGDLQSVTSSASSLLRLLPFARHFESVVRHGPAGPR